MSLRKYRKAAEVTAVCCMALFSACAPVAYKTPDVTLDIKVKENNPLSSSSYLVAELPDESTYPITSPRAFDPAQLCLVLSVTGSGIESSFAEESDFSCQSRFVGLGQLSSVFSYGTKPDVKISYGDRKFDLIGFPKHLFGGSCPSTLSVGTQNGKPVLMADSKALPFPTGAEGPVSISSSELEVSPGLNVIDLLVDTASSSRLIGKNFGCQKFDVSPTAAADHVFYTGLREMFFDVQCPSDADAVSVEVDSGYESGKIPCDPKSGSARVNNVEMDPFDLEASDWGWYEPKIKVSAFQNSSKISSLNYKVSYSMAGDYLPVLDSHGWELGWEMTGAAKDYRIESFNGSHLIVHEKNLSNSQIKAYNASLSWRERGQRLNTEWNGSNVVISSLSGSSLFDETLLTGQIVGWIPNSNDQVRVRRCPAGIDSCPSGWQGIEAAMNAANGSAFEIFTRAGIPMLWALDLSGGLPRSRAFDLSAASWGNEAFALSLSAAYNTAKFAPAWQNPDIRFVKAQPYALGVSDTLLAHDVNLIAGGSAPDADLPSERRSVIYRSFDAGRSWYQVYMGQLDSEILDALPVESSENTGGFVLLEKYKDYDDSEIIRVLSQDAHTSGF